MRIAKTIAVLVAVIGVAKANVINVNMAKAGNEGDGTVYSAGVTPCVYAGSTWNDLINSDVANDLLDTEGVGTGINFRITQTGSIGGFFDSGRMNGVGKVYRARASDWKNPSEPIPAQKVTFTGLDESASYNFYFVCVGNKEGQGAAITYTGTGGVGGVCLANNIYTMSEGNSYLKLTVVNPPNGVAEFMVTGNGVTHWQILNGVQIESIQELETLGLISASAGVLLLIPLHLVS